MKRRSTAGIARLAIILVLGIAGLAGCATTAPRDDTDGMARAQAAWEAERYGQALALLEPEAARGNARAQYAIGYMYYWGQGVEADLDRALDWIRRAAANGNGEAIEALGQLAGTLSAPDRGRRAISTEEPPPAPASEEADVE